MALIEARNMLNALPGWTEADQAAADARRAHMNAFRAEQKTDAMNFLAGITAATIVGEALLGLIAAIEKVALPTLAFVIGPLLVAAGIFGGMQVYNIVSNSDYPIKDVFSSIGKGTFIATIVTIVGAIIVGNA
jgi:hypothetical protein